MPAQPRGVPGCPPSHRYPWGATTRRAVRRGDLWSPVWRVPPHGAGLPGQGTAFFPKESGGKERAGGFAHHDPPSTGVHGGGGL